MSIAVVITEHAGWPERRKGTLIPGLHEVPSRGETVTVVSLDNGELHAVPSRNVFTPEGRAKVDEFIAYLNGPTVGAAFLGWWTDEETGKVWVDGTSHHSTEFVAGRIGRRRREIAIFDIERQRSLRLVYVDGE